MPERVVKLPDIGEGIAEAELVEWHVKVGDAVREDTILGAVMTDKATVEVPSPAEGSSPAAVESAETVENGVDEEMRLLSLAYSFLRAGRPRDALAQLAEHAERFPHGKLAESRQVAHIIALCDSGQSQPWSSDGCAGLLMSQTW